jgi:hypothetical protein
MKLIPLSIFYIIFNNCIHAEPLTIPLKCTHAAMNTKTKCKLENEKTLLSYEDAKLNWAPKNTEMEYLVEYMHNCKGHRTGLAFSSSRDMPVLIRRSENTIYEKIIGNDDLKVVDSFPQRTYNAILSSDCSIKILRVSAFPKLEHLSSYVSTRLEEIQRFQEIEKEHFILLNNIKNKENDLHVWESYLGEKEENHESLMGQLICRLTDLSDFVLDEQVKESLLQEILFLEDLKSETSSNVKFHNEQFMKHAHKIHEISGKEAHEIKKTLRQIAESLEDEIEYLELRNHENVEKLRVILQTIVAGLK